MQEQLFQLIKLRPINENQLKIDTWMQCKTANQLFYNQNSNKFILNDFKNITLFNRNQLESYDAGIKKPIQLLTYNQQQKAIVYCTDRQNGIVYGSFINQIETKFKDVKQIIHFQWLSDKCLADFVVIVQTGLMFLKLEDQKKGFKEIKFISMKNSACWFEWRTETLVTCNYQERGILNIFHLRDKKNKNLYKTGTLQLQFKQEPLITKKGDKSIKFKVASTTSHQPLFNKTYVDSFQIQLVDLYEKPIIILLNLNAGLLDFYQLQQNQVIKLPLAVNLPTDSPAILTHYDNLVMVHLKNDHFSFVYDIKRSGTQPVATPAAIGPDEIYDGQILNRWVLTNNKQVYKWQLEPKAIFKYIKNQGELFLFLMRRRNSKMIVMQWIRENLFEFKATVISSFFKVIFVQHFEALKIGDNDIIEQTISPTDMYANIFFPLQNDSRKQRLVDLMLECQRQFVVHKIQSFAKFQQLVVKLLLEAKKETLLSQLVQSRLIEQSKQIALLLYENSLKNPRQQILKQVAIDILYRKGFHEELIKLFAQEGFISQIIRVVRRNFQQIPLQILITIYRETKEQYKGRLKSALIDLGREFYPVSNQQFLLTQLDKP